MRLKYRDHMRAARREYLQSVLDAAQGNAKVAAELAGVNRTHFHRLLTLADVRKPVLRGNAAWRALSH